ncbi:MAG: hypothetical protein COT33_03405 [Candidatus Nealsonbacteria bacterium CG08_land_8_20_14_0_20_38_20]|uniref:Holo-[acyl-carrier-protein] synthase n=1 Tax=Candidatus Nealsonbacteria bacterium CG08_land_8_20_14_0_20_38_20 TaxID=1974705 RepID=A0A2H0YKZ7_9BACT|nr:MAG: hypothetical protein COT33_03405 [Candidatus Nealsonbacteria bacterium CG08_land_8_20_14_0_20_38_20]
MIFGIGIDILEVKKFKNALKIGGQNFLNLTFTKKERDYAKATQDVRNLAVFFSAKEAVFKSLNLPKSKIKNFNYFKEMEVSYLPSGKPEVRFLDSLAKKFPGENFKIFISISYTSKLAITFAIIEKE